MLHLFCFLYHFQGIQPESGQKNEKSGITDSRTSQHLRADRMSGKEMKMPAKRQQPPLLHHSPKNGNSCHEKPNVNKKPCSKDIFCSYAAFPGIAFSRIKIHSAESDFPMSAELASDLYQKTEKQLLTVEKRCRKPCFPTYMEAREPQKGKTKRQRKRPTERHIKKAMRKTWHILYRKESSKNKRQHSVRFPTHENPLFATAPVPACKYAIPVDPEMTICHFGSYATNCPRARGPPRLSLAWIRGGRNAHGGHAGKCSRRGCCAAHRTSGLP